MPTIISEFIKPVLDIVAFDNLLEHYENPNLLETQIKEYVKLHFGQDYANSISLDSISSWHNDLVDLIDKWKQDQPKDYDILNQWCSGDEYNSIREGQFYQKQDPELVPSQVETNPSDRFAPNIFSSSTIEIAPFWKVIRRGDSYNIQIIYDTTDQLESVLFNFNDAMARLFLSHLFFNVHAGYDKLAGYKVEIFKCNSPRCPEPNNMFLVANRHGRKPTYCSNRCRTYVNVTNSRKAKKGSRIKAV